MKNLKPVFIALSMMVAVAAMAVPAKRAQRTYSQPDGTSVALTLVGDEHCHYYLTADRHIVLPKGGAYYFAEIDAQGLPAPSAISASDPDKRTPAQSAFLSRIDRNRLQTAMLQKADLRRSAMRRSAASASGVGLLPNSKFPTSGSPRGLVILVAYSDYSFKTANADTYFTRQLNEPGFSDDGATGSARDFFTDMSAGAFTPEFDVYGPVTLTNTRAYYGGNDSSGNDRRPAQMIHDACRALDSEIDFSQYDMDNDGYVDIVYVIYAGVSEASSDEADAIWPHQWTLSSALGSTLTLDGVKVNSYACSNEWETGRSDGSEGTNGIGTFVHEFSHVLGLPDSYNTVDLGSYADAFWYDVMDQGNYNNDSRTPAGYSIFQRNALKWISPTEITDPACLSMSHTLSSGDGYIICTDSDNEFFLLENRQLSSWDSYLPYHGMLIWHIDYNASAWTANQPNGDANHQRIRLVRANNVLLAQTDSKGYIVYSDFQGFPFPGTQNVTSFTASTTPAFQTWAGTAIDLPITDIAEAEGVISFKVLGGVLDTPEAALPDDVGVDYFTAKWTAVRGASDYLVTVSYIDPEGAISRAETLVTVDGYDGASAGGATQLRIDHLVEGISQYQYTVKAVNPANNVVSAESDPVTVSLQSSLVTDIQSLPQISVCGRTLSIAGARADIHDLCGRRLASGVSSYVFPASGVYIITCGDTSRRVYVK